MQFAIFSFAYLAAPAAALFCGVVTSPFSSYVPCTDFQFPAMDAQCQAIGGTVSGHLQEAPGGKANCVTYCNQVPTGNHDTTGTTDPGEYTWHLYVVDSCDSCSYCGDVN